MNGYPPLQRLTRSRQGQAPDSGNESALSIRRGLSELILYLALSILYFSVRNTDLLASLSEPVRQLLGCPPPPVLIDLAVTGYTLSAAILVRGRMVKGKKPEGSWAHLAFWTVFYFFYALAGALPAHFMGAFCAGLFIVSLEQLHIWAYDLRNHPEGKALFGRL